MPRKCLKVVKEDTPELPLLTFNETSVMVTQIPKQNLQ
jgi:hypothetical protein